MKTDDFNGFELDKYLIDRLTSRRITTPTYIQEEVIPKVLKGISIVASSKTGTGKTLAYILPLLQLNFEKNHITLIIAPTKELANQIFLEIKYYTEGTEITSILLIGGDEYEKQEYKLKKGIQIVVGVTGRIVKLIEDQVLKVDKVKSIVLDEVDFLVELGFWNDIKKIFDLSFSCNQYLLFSATLSTKTKELLSSFKKIKKYITISEKIGLPKNIENCLIPLGDDRLEEKTEEKAKDSTLLKLLKNITPYLSLIFVRTKKESYWVYNILKENDYNVGILNGDLSPLQRKQVVKEFKDAKIQYLVTTDLASRGISIDGINVIINYTIPINEKDYLHRAGRSIRNTADEKNNSIIYNLCNILDEGYLRKYLLQLNDTPLTALKVTDNDITVLKNYQGVKPRLNIEEKKREIKLKQINKSKKMSKKREINHNKKVNKADKLNKKRKK